MPREIKTTIAVDGEAAFKRAINDANTSMRNLGTQLTLAQAQFKKDGDAMKLMETRSKALKSEIDQQEKIVTALEKAVKDSADAFGENSQKTEKWEAELNRAKAKLANLQSELTLNDAGLDRNGKSFDESSQKAADYQATLQTIGKNVSFQTVTEGISGITSKLEAAAKKVWNFAKDLRDAMADSAGWADELITSAKTHGITIEEEQRWQYAAKFVDTEVKTIFNAQDRLGKKMKSGWKDGSIDMWEMLGIDLKDAETGAWRDKMDVMFELGETLMSMTKIDGNDVRADAYAMEVFGKSWRELLPLFDAGEKAFKNYMAETPIVADESVLALGSYKDALDALDSSWETLQHEFFASMAPTLTEVTNALSGMLNEFNEWLKTEDGKEAMKGLSDALKELFSGVKDIKFSDAINTAKDAVNALKDGLQWLAGHKESIFGALKVIAGGFALLKVSDTVLKFLQIKNGLGGLFGGKNTSHPTGNQGIAGSPAADAGAAAGGGWFAGVSNAATAAAAKAGSFMTANMGMLGAAYDMFLNQTNTGRALRDGMDFFDGLKQDATEFAGNFAKNLETFSDDWANNVLVKATRDATEGLQKWLFGSGEEQPKTEDSAFEKAAREYHAEHATPQITPEEWAEMSRGEQEIYMKLHPLPTQEEMNQEYLNGTTFWNATPDSGSAGQQAAEQLADGISSIGDTLSDAVAEMRVNTESAKASTDKIAGADFKRFNNLPSEIQAAAQRGTANGVSGIQVRLDGYTVGRLIAPVVSNWIASYAQ